MAVLPTNQLQMSLYELGGRLVLRLGPNGFVRGRPLFFGVISEERKRQKKTPLLTAVIVSNCMGRGVMKM